MSGLSHHALVDSQFGPRAQSYLASAVHAAGQDLERMTALIGERPDATAIDIGCGAGHASFRLAALVKDIVAYDVSDRMIAVVAEEAKRRRLTNIVIRQGPAELLPYQQSTFDFAVSRYSAHHWQDAPAGLVQMSRVLKPGALAVIGDVISPGVPLLDTWLQAAELLRDPSHVRDYSLPEWLLMLTAAKLVPVEVSTLRLRLDWATWIQRMNTPPDRVDVIRSLQHEAASAVAKHFDFELDGTFTVDTVVIAARAAK